MSKPYISEKFLFIGIFHGILRGTLKENLRGFLWKCIGNFREIFAAILEIISGIFRLLGIFREFAKTNFWDLSKIALTNFLKQNRMY